jgi:predicted homoserine dehydrogenase-like protein
VVCYAKQPLNAGDRIDGPGGFCCYGLIENRGAAAPPGLPICLVNGARLNRPVGRDERIAWDDVDVATIAPAALAAYRRAETISAEPAAA